MASETTSSKDNIPDSARLIPKDNTEKGDHILTITDDMAIDKDAKKYTVSSETKNSVECKVLMLDGTDVKIKIPNNANGQALFTLACEHINLLEKEYFALSFKESSDVKVWLQNDKPIAKQLKKLKWEFSFEVKFYPHDPCVLREEITRYQLYLQIRVDILAGRLPCSFVSNSLLGSYACQSQLGDWDPAEHGQSIDYIKSIKFCPGQSDELIEKIAELHRTNQGMMADEAEYNYLENAKHMALYGVHQIPAKDQDNSSVMIGICAAGLLIYRDKIRLNRYIWPKIMKIAYKRNNFMIHLRGTPPVKTETIQTFKLANYKTAKRTWRLAVEHHAFFRLREPEEAPRGVFMRRGQKYFSGVTQFQADKAAEMIKRESQNFSRVYYTMGRGDIGVSKYDQGFSTLTVERKEETIEVDNTMRTLERTKRSKSSIPTGDGVDGQENAGPFYDPYGNRVQNQSISSTGDVFMNSARRPSHDDFRGEYAGKEGHHVTMNVGPGDSYGMTYSKTPYPTGPGYTTPGGGPGLTTPLYAGTPGGTGYNTFGYYNSGNAYGVDERGNKFSNGEPVHGDDQFLVGQEDHLKQQFTNYGQAGWLPQSTTSTTKTLTRTYTAPDGTIVTETRTEKNGVVETHIEKRRNTVDMDDDHDKMLADAIRSVTDMNPDLSVEKIEITKSE